MAETIRYILTGAPLKGYRTYIIGGIMIGGSFTILRIPKNEFVEHLALALSLAGQALVVFAIFEIFNRNEKMGLSEFRRSVTGCFHCKFSQRSYP